MNKDYSVYIDYQVKLGALNRDSDILSASLISSIVNGCYVVSSLEDPNLPNTDVLVPGDTAIVSGYVVSGDNSLSTRTAYTWDGQQWQPQTGKTSTGDVHFNSNFKVDGIWRQPIDGMLSNDGTFLVEGKPLDQTISGAISAITANVSRVTIGDDPTPADLSVHKATNAEFFDLVLASAILSNDLYVIEDTYVDIYGQEIKNVLSSTEQTNAATVGQVDAAAFELCMHANQICTDLSTEVDSKIGNLSVALCSEISAETSARISADDALSTALCIELSTETSARISADEFLSNAVSSKIWIEDRVSSDICAYSDLSVVKLPKDQYEDLAIDPTRLCANVLYVVESNYIDAYGEQIKNVASPIDLSDATTKEYVDDLVDIAHVTYSELSTLRANNGLKPGKQYRITDYVATTNGDMESRSANHPFDIIVTADDEHTLNEHARAIMHDGDLPDDTVNGETRTKYFASCNLAAWDIWYCFDNDTTRFAWALAEGTIDPQTGTTGRGVVYRLVDELQNDCPYDFKGLQFKAYGDTDDVWRYTFDSGSASNSIDLSKFGLERYVFKNTIGQFDGDSQKLNRIVFKGAGCYSNTFGPGCCSNTFGSYCSSNTFSFNCSSNTFSFNCCSNTFGPGCYSNIFGESCSSNTFVLNCFSNTFGESCYSNMFGESCSSNTFGEGCYSNTFGFKCSSNTFDAGCSSNTLGAWCSSNTFSLYCYSNTFGSYCSSNMFGFKCYFNTFGPGCSFNTFGPGCYVGVWSDYSQRYVGTVVKYNNVLRTVLKRYRALFSTSQTYLVGETLYYQSKYWECTTEHSGTWNAVHFTEIPLVGSILSVEEYVPLSYYRYVELEDGVSYVALDCTVDRGDVVYYQNVTVSKGIGGTESAPKHIEDANYSQTSKTTYQPADSQVISI